MRKTQKLKIVIIVGPTASGKSSLAVSLAKKFRGEVVSADSRQIYKGLNIGSGKITSKEMQHIPHYLLNVASPKRTFTVAQYVRQAEKAVRGIARRGNVPVVVGGTGFYIRALVDGMAIPEVPPNLKLRKKLEKYPAEKLLQILQDKDPRRARTIEKKNKRRLIRALEIIEKLGKVPRLKTADKYAALFIGIKIDPSKLRQRINQRLRERIAHGMVAEVRRLRRYGLSWQRLENFGLEYKYISLYLQGKIAREEMLQQLENAIWCYSKRQMTWFKRDTRIRWVEDPTQAITLVRRFLQK